MTQNGFTMYMLSAENDVFNPDHARVYQDMTRPLAHYFISSSHNTYLTKDQVTSASSTEPYIRYSEKNSSIITNIKQLYRFSSSMIMQYLKWLSLLGLWIRAVAAWSWTVGMEIKVNLSSTMATLSPPKCPLKRSFKPSPSMPSRYVIVYWCKCSAVTLSIPFLLPAAEISEKSIRLLSVTASCTSCGYILGSEATLQYFGFDML